MEDNKKTVEDNINDDIKGTGESGTQNTQNNEKMKYTQEDFNALDKKLKEKYEKKYAGIDIAKYNEWVESQKTAEQKQAEREKEYQNALSEKQSLINENKVLKKGVNSDDVDYVLFKVSKMEGEFDENLAKFLKDNPRYLNTEPKIVKKVGSSMSLNGKTQVNETNQLMNDLIRSSRD